MQVRKILSLTAPSLPFQDQAGWVGFASSIAGIAGTLTIGRIADAFSHHLKFIVIIFLIVAVIFCAWMTAIIDGLLGMNFGKLTVSLTVVSDAVVFWWILQ
jgi:MFS family permease